MNNFEIANDVIIKAPTVNPYATAKLQGIKISFNANDVAASGDKNTLIPIIAGLMSLTGQRPRVIRAKESVAAFRVRKHMEIGGEITIRNRTMKALIERLRIILPQLGTSVTLLQKRIGIKELYNAQIRGTSQRQRLGGAHLEFKFEGEGWKMILSRLGMPKEIKS